MAALWILLLPSQAFATVLTLQSVALQAADAPPGLSHPRLALYNRYAATMTVTIETMGTPQPSSCAVPSSYAHDGWHEGMIQAFDQAKLNIGLQLCAYLFATPAGAHKAYRAGVRHIKILMALGRRLDLPTVGDESLGAIREFKECVCTTVATYRTYEIVFRHGNAVMDLSYTGVRSFGPSDFQRLVARVNTRLR